MGINENNILPLATKNSLDTWINNDQRKGMSQIKNSGSYASYYDINPEWCTLQDIIEDRKLNYAQGNILKAAFTFNIGRHDGTDEIRDLEKIIYFAKRELERIKKGSKDAEPEDYEPTRCEAVSQIESAGSSEQPMYNPVFVRPARSSEWFSDPDQDYCTVCTK